MINWQISKPKLIVDWYLDFSKESYTTLKSVISSFKICFQNYGQLKRKFLRPKNRSSTFLKFELSRLGGPMLKTRKNTIRNQFEQQWFNVISFQKPRRVYTAIWYKLKPFPIKKGRFKLPTPAKCTSHVKLSREGKALILKSLTYSKRFTSMKSDFILQNNVVNVCCSYLSMAFPYIGNVKYPHGRTYQQQRFKSQRRKNAKIALHFTERPLTTALLSLVFSLEATRSFHFVMNDSWSALPWKRDPGQVIRKFKTPVVFSGFSRGVARIFPEVRPTFSASSSPPIPPTPHPKCRLFY